MNMLTNAEKADNEPNSKNPGDKPSLDLLRITLMCCGMYDANIPTASRAPATNAGTVGDWYALQLSAILLLFECVSFTPLLLCSYFN